MLNITTFLDANSCRLAKPVFFCPERNTSYTSAEILSISSAIARDLLSLGAVKGDRILLYMNSSPEYLFSYFAVWRIGCVSVPTNRVYTSSELAYMAKNSGAKIFITDPNGVSAARDLQVRIYVPGDIESLRGEPRLLPAHTEHDDLCQRSEEHTSELQSQA